MSTALQADSLPSEPPGKPFWLRGRGRDGHCSWTVVRRSSDWEQYPLWLLIYMSWGFPAGSVIKNSDKESVCQCRRWRKCRFDPWARRIPWRRKWQPAPVFLPGKYHGQSSLAGYSLWSRKEFNMTKQLSMQAYIWVCIVPGGFNFPPEPRHSPQHTFFCAPLSIVFPLQVMKPNPHWLKPKDGCPGSCT